MIREGVVLPPATVRPTTAETGGDDVDEYGYLDSGDPAGLALGVDEARVIVDFAVGSSGVGPVLGFGSGDFFPSAPYSDTPNHPGVGEASEAP